MSHSVAQPVLHRFAFCTILVLLLLNFAFGVPLARATASGANGAVGYLNVVGSPWAVFTTENGNVSNPVLNQTFDFQPAWSPDGEQIAFHRYDSADDYTIMIVDKNGGNPRALLTSDEFVQRLGRTDEGVELLRPTWSPDGQKIAFVVRDLFIQSAYGIWTINVDGTGLSQVVFNEYFNALPLPDYPEWSPDGKEIVFICQRRQLNGGNFYGEHLCVVNVASGAKRELLLDHPNRAQDGPDRPKWTPDGRRLLFGFHYGDFEAGQFIERFDIWSMKPDGTDIRVHTREPNACPESNLGAYSSKQYRNPSPSPDGKWIVVERNDSVVTAIVEEGETFRCQYGSRTLEASNYGLWLLKADYDLPPGSPAGTLMVPASSSGQNPLWPDWQPIPAQVLVQVDDGHGNALRGLKVELRTMGGDPITDKVPVNRIGGSYAFNDVAPGDYRVRATLIDNDVKEGEVPSFEIRHIVEQDIPVWVETLVKVPPQPGKRVKVVLSFKEGPALHDTSVEDVAGFRSRLDDMANIYFRTRQFVDWVKANVVSNTGDTVEFYTFAEFDPINGELIGADRARHWGGDSAVVFGTRASAYENRDGVSDNVHDNTAPENGEWHEFTHHIYHTYISGVPCNDPYNNHDGYKNIDTCDSLKEGFASFLPTLAARAIDGVSDSNYDGFLDVEWDIKAWSYRVGSDGALLQEAEDLAVAALLWDLVDNAVDLELARVVAPDDTHVVTTYKDETSMSLKSLWNQMADAETMITVKDLRDSFGTPDITVDLDDDSVPDVAQVDQVFLMHGFYPIKQDQEIGGLHWSYHYDVNGVNRLCPSCPRNRNVGLSDHRGPDIAGNIVNFDARKNLTPAAGANLGISAQDASGTPLTGAAIELSIRYPGEELPRPTGRRLATGAADPAHLELPAYFNYMLDAGAPLPACDPANDVQVEVTVTATINGYKSADETTFDNCTYQRAIASGADPAAALQLTLNFPEDAATPATASDPFASEPPIGNVTVGTWTVDLFCTDPVEDNFASGCARTEYRLDGGPVESYIDPVVIEEVGTHILEYRSVDAAGNTEDFQSIELVIAAGPPPSITSFTPSAGAIGASVTIAGEHFDNASAVSFNGTGAAFTVNSPTQITATVPTGAALGPIAVTTPYGTASSATDFVVLLPPTITSFSPGTGQAGTVVTIFGTYFHAATGVAFNGTNAGFSIITPGLLTAVVPPGATTGPIRVTTPVGVATSSNSFVIPVGPPPSITGFTPASGIAGTSVTINGANLVNATAVTFNGANAAFRLKRGVLSATVPAGASTGPIAVTTPGGTATSPTNFVVPLPPTIGGFSPASGPGGTVVTISGENFTGASAVRIGGSSVKYTVVSETTITATVAKGTKSGTVSVTTPGGTATSAGSFTVLR